MTLRLSGDTSGFTEIKAANAAGDNSIKLPAANGGANQLLQNGGTAGELQYTSAGGGLHYDSAGRLLIGHNSSSGTGEIQSANASGENLSVYRFAANGGSPDISFNKSRNASLGAHTVLNDGDALGQLAFRGSDGTAYRTGASIQARIQGNPGASNMPSYLGFYTNSGSASAREVVRITAAGALKLVDSTGIDFSGFQNAAVNSAVMTSETLDSYEEGTWTPTTTLFTNTIDATECRYTKIGRVVYLTGQIGRDQAVGPTNNIFTVQGLPFLQNAVTRSISGNFWLDNGSHTTDTIGGITYMNNTTDIIFAISTNPAQQSSTRYVRANSFNNTRGIMFSATYITDT